MVERMGRGEPVTISRDRVAGQRGAECVAWLANIPFDSGIVVTHDDAVRKALAGALVYP
jgi:hypothetical protein